MDYLGVGIGAGLGGASVALADAGTISIEAGLAGCVRDRDRRGGAARPGRSASPGDGRRVREVVGTLGAPSRHAEPTYLFLSVELPPPPPLPLDPELAPPEVAPALAGRTTLAAADPL